MEEPSVGSFECTKPNMEQKMTEFLLWGLYPGFLFAHVGETLCGFVVFVFFFCLLELK